MLSDNLFLLSTKIEILQITLEARKRRIFYELCYVFFNPTTFKLFSPVILESYSKFFIFKIFKYSRCCRQRRRNQLLLWVYNSFGELNLQVFELEPKASDGIQRLPFSYSEKPARVSRCMSVFVNFFLIVSLMFSY